MDTIEPKKPALMSFFAVSAAPVVTFVLANALFLPLVLAMADFSNSSLADMVSTIDNPLISRLVFVVMMLFVPITAVMVLIGPALTSFLVNLKHPVLTSRSMALWSGVVFFVFQTMLLIILIGVRNSALSPMPSGFPFMRPAIDPLAIFGVLGGMVLSGSVALFGWLGARKKQKKM